MEETLTKGTDRPEVLVVDDDPDVLASLVDELSEGYAVTPAPSGEEALSLLGKRPFDAIISDVRMPGISGVEVIRQAHALDADVVRILLTGYSDEAARSEALAAGGAYKLSKPWGEELEIILKRALEQRQAVRRSRAELWAERQFREQTEQAVSELNRMAALGTLAAGVVHELRQPLTCLVANLDAMRAHLAAHEELKELFSDCADSTRRIQEIVDGLSTYSAPARRARCRPLDIQRCVTRAVQMMGYEHKRNVAFRAEVAPDVGRVCGHEGEIIQILINLMLNSIQAMAGHGSLEARVRQTETSVTIEVEDSGPGVSDAARQQLFQPFFTTKPDAQCNGLGLWISRKIARRHGGDLRCLPRPPPGAVFVLELPLDTGEPRPERR